jgi:hypothetical protein
MDGLDPSGGDQGGAAAPAAAPAVEPAQGSPAPAAEAPKVETVGDRTNVPQTDAQRRRQEALDKVERFAAEREAELAGKPPPPPPERRKDPILDDDRAEPWSVSRDELEALPDAAKKTVANLRAQWTRKNQELAAKMKSLDEQAQALVSDATMQRLRDAQVQTGGEESSFDPFDPDSVAAYIQHQVQTGVAKGIEELINPVREQTQLAQRRQQLEVWKAQNPEIENPEVKLAVARELDANDALSLEVAFELVMARRQRDEVARLRAEREQERAAARAAGLKIGGSSRASGVSRVPEHVRRQGAAAVYQWKTENNAW